MTIFLLANTVFLLGSVAYGWLAGDRHDREGVIWILAALGGTWWAQSIGDPTIQGHIIQAVDAALLLAMVSLALRSNRYWPTWFAGLHLTSVVLMLASFSWSELVGLRTIGAFFGTLAILAMVIGIFLDRMALERSRSIGAQERFEG